MKKYEEPIIEIISPVDVLLTSGEHDFFGDDVFLDDISSEG